MKSLLWSRRKLALLIFAGVAIAILFLFLRSRPEVEMLTTPPPPQRARLAFLGRWMWPVKRQLLRVKRGLFGTPALVNVSAVIAELDPASEFPGLHVLSAVTNAAGEKILIVNNPAGFREPVARSTNHQILSQPRILTGEGMQAQLAASQFKRVGPGTNAPLREVGYWLDVWPRRRGANLDVTCFFVANELVRGAGHGNVAPGNEIFLRTNLALGARLTLPPGAGLLLLGRATNDKGKVTGVLLESTVVPRK